jgi:hypothetical protein
MRTREEQFHEAGVSQHSERFHIGTAWRRAKEQPTDPYCLYRGLMPAGLERLVKKSNASSALDLSGDLTQEELYHLAKERY